MFYIIVYGSWGNCIIDQKGDPTWDIENALTFKTRQEAGDYITAHWKEWKEDKDTNFDYMRIYEKKEAGYEEKNY